MCYTCGCNKPWDDMGEKGNISEKNFEIAGQTGAIGQEGKISAKRHMYSLLKKEFDAGEEEKPKQQY